VGEKERGQGPPSKTVIPFLPSVQNRGEKLGAARRPAPAIAGVPGVDGGRGQGEKEEGGDGYLLRCSPWLGAA
jgi:hypothetical protein